MADAASDTPYTSTAEASKSGWSYVFRVSPVILTWATFSCGLSYYNSWMLSRRAHRFPFPMFYTGLHMITQVIAMQIILIFRPDLEGPSWGHFKKQWKLIVAMCFFALCAIGGENASLTMVSLTVHESAKSAVPLFTMILSALFEGRFYRLICMFAVVSIAFCTALVTAGVVSSHDANHNEPLGIALTVFACLASAARPVTMALLMRHTPDGTAQFANPFLVIWYEGLLTSPYYVLLWLVTGEAGPSLAYMRAHPGPALMYNAAGSTMAIFYIIALMYMIQMTSALTSTMLGTVKHVGMAIVAAILVDHTFSGANTAANTVVAFGLGLYIPSTALYAYLMLTDQAYDTKPMADVKPTEGSSLLAAKPDAKV